MSKHLTLDNRFDIYKGLNERKSICSIARLLEKHSSTITNEILKHYVRERSGAYGRSFNDCLFRTSCKKRKDRRTATPCYSVCKDYRKEVCSHLNSTPYVCNGCKERSHCALEKRSFKPKEADQFYHTTLHEARSGFSLTEMRIQQIDLLVSSLIKKGQSIHHIHTIIMMN